MVLNVLIEICEGFGAENFSRCPGLSIFETCVFPVKSPKVSKMSKMLIGF